MSYVDIEATLVCCHNRMKAKPTPAHVKLTKGERSKKPTGARGQTSCKTSYKVKPTSSCRVERCPWQHADSA